MPVSRINNQIDLKKSDSVLLIYGQVNDTFVTSDLALYNVDGIEKIICRYLKENGYDQIIFYAPERQLYTYDEQSYQYCFPETVSNLPLNNQAEDSFGASNMNGRPLGSKKYLKTSTRVITPPPSPSASENLYDAQRSNLNWNVREGFISVIRRGGDASVVDIIREALFQNNRKSVVVLSQFDNPDASSEILRLILPLIPRLKWRRNLNKLIIITNAVDQTKLNEVVTNVPALNGIIKMEDANKGLDSLIYIGYPQKDEIRNLIHRERILRDKPVNWHQLERLVRGLDQVRDELKRWERDFQDIPAFDVTSINTILKEPLSEDDISPFAKLDRLIGLKEAKNKLRRHLWQIQDTLEHNPKERPLMHIVLKGNPGTGKTTLARLISEVLREEGLLERGHLIEVDRARLVAGYIGQTALKTDDCCKEALGGVLFVDEAYALAPRESNSAGGGSQDFGQEAIDTLIKRMTDWQHRFCVILAGYPDDMERLLATNPGFTGRIGLELVIEDYLPEELTQIFVQKAHHAQRLLSDEFESAILNVFTTLYRKRGKKFDNGRTVEQIFGKINGLHIERCRQNQLNRKEEPFMLIDIPAEYEKEETTEKGGALERLNAMIGLEKAKNQIKKQVNLIRAGRESEGFATGRRLHLVFKGNPGTGKTTVARLVGEIYQHHQILPNNVFVEVTRKDLVGGYQGQTATKVEEKCKEALGGILFIDEVYTLINGDTDQFGKEAVDTLMKFIDDEKERVCVIIAGYPDKIKDFLESNPGLKRRFPTEIEFEDYTGEQLFQIFNRITARKNLTLEEDMRSAMQRILQVMYEQKNEHFGNAGVVENAVQGIQENFIDRCLNAGLDFKNESISKSDIPPDLIEKLPVDNNDEIINAAIAELQAMAGLTSVKKFVDKLVKEYKHEKVRQERKGQISNEKKSYHMIFKGNPGTGKTTVARIMGRIFKALDILKKGEVKEVSRHDFIAGYQGQTAEKTRKLILNSFDNILFIDEAYSLVNDNDSFGMEAVNTLLKMMEDHRDRIVVIITGYPREMRMLLRTNSGLASRFPNDITFADYEIDELIDIFKSSVQKQGYILEGDFEDKLSKNLNYLKSSKGANFGNARDVKNFLDKIILPKYRDRVEALDVEDEAYWAITPEDFPEINIDESGKDPSANKSDFSLNEEKNKQRDVNSNMSHHGTGDNVGGDKYIINNYGKEASDLPQILTPIPEFMDFNILFRDKEVSEIHEYLFSTQQRYKVVLYGIGGIGKTKTVLKFIKTYLGSFDHIIWLKCISGIKKAFIEDKLLIDYLKVSITVNEDEDTRLKYIIKAINALKKKCLIILDNMPKSCESEFLSLSEIFPSKDTNIIGTSREEIKGAKNILIKPFDHKEAIQFFKSIAPNAIDARLDEILVPISNHPLAIEMIGKIIENTPVLNYNQLIASVKQGLHLEKGDIDIDYAISDRTDLEVVSIFKSIFDFVKLEPEEITYLVLFSVLPSVPIPMDQLIEVFSVDTEADINQLNKVISSLKKKGVLVEDKERGYYCHQIVQQVCREQYKPDLEQCKPLFLMLGGILGVKIDDALSHTGSIFKLVSDYLYILEHFIQYFEGQDLLFNRVYINLSVLYRVNGQFEKSISVSEKELQLLEPQKQIYPVLYNIVCRNIAFAQTSLGRHAEAELFYQQGVSFLEQIERENNPDREIIEKELILSYAQLGILQLRVEKHDIPQASTYFEKGLAVADQMDTEDAASLASLKEGLALAKIEEGDCEEAVIYLVDARKLLIRVDHIDKNSLPYGLLNISLAIAYAGVKNFKNAQFYSGEAIKILKHNQLPEDSLEFFRAYFARSVVFLQNALHDIDNEEDPNLEMLDEAGNALKTAIDILKNNRGSDHEDLGMMYSNYGIILKYTGKEAEGYEYHKMGMDIYKKLGNRNMLVSAMYFRTIFFFETYLTSEIAKEYLFICLEIIPETHENLINIGFVNYCLGLVQHKDGRSRDGIEYVNKALNLVLRHNGKDVDPNPKNDSPLEVVCLQEMARMHSSIGDHFAAVTKQKEAILICERNMNADDDELSEPYIAYAKICFAAAQAEKDNKLYADALEYKTKVSLLKKELLLKEENKELEDAGELYRIVRKNEKGETTNHFVVIPTAHFDCFEKDQRENKLADLNTYGYELPSAKGGLDFIALMSTYSHTYGSVNSQFANS